MRIFLSIFLMMMGLVLNAQCEYYETFESYSNGNLPDDWSVINTTNATSVVAQVQTNANAPSPDKYFRFFNNNANTGDFIVVLPLNANTSDGNHRISFYLSGVSTASSSLQVGTIDVPDETGTFTMIEEISEYASGTEWGQHYVNIPEGTNQYIAFRHSLSGTFHPFNLDNICVQEIPSCLEVSALSVTDRTNDGFQLEWTASQSNETNWEYLALPAGSEAPQSDDSGVEVNQNSATISGLEPNTAYDLYVRAKCSGTDFGSWIGAVTATTLCDPFTTGFFSGFEDNIATEEVKPCWNVYDTASNADLKTFGSSFGTTPSEGSLQLRFFFASSTPNNSLALITPQFSDLSSDKQIRFKMTKRAGTDADMVIEIGTVQSPSDMDSFVLLDDTTLVNSTVVGGVWNEYTIPLTNYDENLGHQFIAMRAQHSGTGATQYIFMDEFNYEFNPELMLNDEPEFADPIEISQGAVCENPIEGNWEGATQSEEFPCNAPTFSEFADLWYRFVAPEDGTYSFGLDIPGTDANLVVWHLDGEELVQMSSGCLTRFTAQQLTAGETYYISIGSPDPTTEFSLCVRLLEVPENDEIENAQTLLESETNDCENAVEGTTGLATYSDDSACSSSTKDVWYAFTPTQTAEYTFRRFYINGSAPTGITVYAGNPGSLTPVNAECGSEIVLVNLTAGETYFVAVSSSVSSNPVFFSLCAYPSPPAPANDSCEAPVELVVGSSFEENVIIGDNTSATVDAENTPFPDCGTLDFETRSRDVWFTVTVPESGNFVIETRGISGSLIYDTVMETYTGSCGIETLEPYFYNMPPPNPGQAFCNDQFVIGGNQFAGIRFENKMPGEQVKIRVWGWASQFGEFQISAYDDTETCVNPTNINVSEIQENQATISWDAPATAPIGGYAYIVQPSGLGYPGNAEGIQTDETSVVVDGLSLGVEYDVYVRSICSTNNSAWEGPVTFETITMGVNDAVRNQPEIYPNPVTDYLNIKYDQKIQSIKIFNLQGQLVKKVSEDASSVKLYIEDLSSGVYVLNIETESENHSIKIIKK